MLTELESGRWCSPDSSASKDPWAVLESQIVACRQCPRLVGWREQVALERRRAYRDWEYWGKPVPGFGDPQARLLVVGLAPGAHGANRTGRMFTGDGSGVFLYRALYKAGFANQPETLHRGRWAAADRSLYLRRLPLRAAAKQALAAGDQQLPALSAARNGPVDPACKGSSAWAGLPLITRSAFTASEGMPLPRLEFSHGAFYTLGADLPWLLASYHPSRQNTQTGRLTEPMFDDIWAKARELLA